MQSPHSSAARDVPQAGHPLWEQDPWLIFNQQLSRDAAGLPNEAFLDQTLEMARDLEIADARVFWLTISRIAELAIRLAGDYADGCEFQAAGDLLVNPRRIDVYQRGNAAVIRKDRHGAVSEQFAAVIGTRHPVAWFKRETHFQIKSEALLPHLNGVMHSSGYFAHAYLGGFEERMRRVADTIAFLSAWQITENQERLRQMHQASPADRELILGNLCAFDDHIFIEMGEDLENIILRGEHRSRFLDHLSTGGQRS